MDDLFDRLAAPFPADRVHWRVGSMTKDKTRAKALAYIDARDVMRRLDETVGTHGWQSDYPPSSIGLCCRIGIKIDAEWVWKANGAGETDIEGAKGGYSDAFKRAAVLWGIGRYLYDLDSPWVSVNQYKQIEPGEMQRLRALLEGAPPKSAYAARKEGMWGKLAAGLDECRDAVELGNYLTTQRGLIAQMPPGWAERWQELVAAAERRIDGRQSANGRTS